MCLIIEDDGVSRKIGLLFGAVLCVPHSSAFCDHPSVFLNLGMSMTGKE